MLKNSRVRADTPWDARQMAPPDRYRSPPRGLCRGRAPVRARVLGKTPVDLTPEAHFWPVLLAAGTAAVVAVGLTLAGVRARDGRAILLGTAFSTTTALLAVHGFATPGVVVGMNGVIALAGGISLPVGAGLLALTALPGLRQPAPDRPAARPPGRARDRRAVARRARARQACAGPLGSAGREPAGDGAARLRPALPRRARAPVGSHARTHPPSRRPAGGGRLRVAWRRRCTPSSRSALAPQPSTAATRWSSAGSR